MRYDFRGGMNLERLWLYTLLLVSMAPIYSGTTIIQNFKEDIEDRVVTLIGRKNIPKAKIVGTIVLGAAGMSGISWMIWRSQRKKNNGQPQTPPAPAQNVDPSSSDQQTPPPSDQNDLSTDSTQTQGSDDLNNSGEKNTNPPNSSTPFNSFYSFILQSLNPNQSNQQQHTDQ